MADNPRPDPARHAGISLTKDPRRARLSRDLRRMRRALERSSHPSWLALDEAPRLVGNYVFDNMRPEDRAALSRNMKRCAEEDAEYYYEWYRDLGNMGISADDENPTDNSMCNFLERLAAVRTEPHCDLWFSLLNGLSEGGGRDNGPIGELFETASGISDETLFGGAKFGGPQAPEEEALVREAVDRLNKKRDSLRRAGYAIPLAHADLDLFYPEPMAPGSREQELGRLAEALDRMPHPSWDEIYGCHTRPAIVGDYIHSRLSPGERRVISENMRLASPFQEEPSKWHDILRNVNLETGMSQNQWPNVNELSEFIEALAEYRTRDYGEYWPDVILGLCVVPGYDKRILALFEEATGISEALLFGPHESEEEEVKAREAVEALNRRRDELASARKTVPRALINWDLFYPRSSAQPPIPTLGQHRRPPQS